ncbi:MAG TPA: hypoxanthine phosphoribosyltransferase [bacterium]|nr:hypoxanthine phosphoribosyltransferase [bacterium]
MKTLLSPEEIGSRVAALGSEISRDYDGRELVAAGVLKGAFVFLADLVRRISVPLHCEFLRVSSYADNRSSGEVRLDFDLTQPVEGKHVLLVEDIVDTGRTLRFLLEHLASKKPLSVRVCSLLYKEVDPSVRPLIDYVGFTIPNEYVVGYGMDDRGMLRSLPDIRTL